MLTLLAASALQAATVTASATGLAVTTCDPSFVPADMLDLQTRMKACPPGTTYRFAAGVYRPHGVLVLKNGDKLIGAGSGPGGTSFLGSIPITSWTKVGSLWVHTGDATQVGVMRDQCLFGTACEYQDWLYRNGQWLTRVVAPCIGLTADQFCIDYTGDLIYLGTDPATDTLEYAVEPKLMAARTGANNVTVQDFAYSEFASLEGTIVAGQGWQVINVHGHHNHSCGVSADLSSPTAPSTIENSTFDYNGYHGFCDPADKVRLINNDFSFNNALGFTFGTGVGLHGSAGLLKNNRIHDNYGVGLKAAVRLSGVGSHDLKIIGNTVMNNADEGIRLMQSCRVTITRNHVLGNAGFGIDLYNSNSNAVTNNTIDVPASSTGGGIRIGAQQQTGRNNCGSLDDARNNTVTGNDVTMGSVAANGPFGNINGTVVNGGMMANETFSSNHYHLPGGDCSVDNWWGFVGRATQPMNFSAWQQTGQDRAPAGTCGA
jgi:parallel beta-helix repeat protein